MNILAACTGPDSPVRRFVFKSSTHYYGSEQDDPAFFTERDAAPASAARGDRARHRRGRAGGRATSPTATPRSTVTVLRCANVLGPDVDTAFTRMLSPAAGADGARASTRGFSSCTRTTSCTRSSTRPSTSAGHLQRRRRRRARALGGDHRPARQAGPCRSCRRGRPALMPGRCGGSGFRIPDEVINLLRFGRGVDNRLFKATRASSYGYTTRETVLKLRRAPAAGAGDAGRRAGLHLRARGGGVPALEPARAARAARASVAASARTVSRSASAPPRRRIPGCMAASAQTRAAPYTLRSGLGEAGEPIRLGA